MNKVFVLDNYDSFVYNLVHMIEEITGLEPVIKRNDQCEISEITEYKKILLSPGPGVPMEAGIMPDVIQALGPTHSILGVCLGHQCIGEAFGAQLENLTDVSHGVEVETNVTDSDEFLFQSMPSRFVTGRYHSWVISRHNFPNDKLLVTADDDAGRIMGVRHTTYDVRGVQFHPESIMTQQGHVMLKNWLEN